MFRCEKPLFVAILVFQLPRPGTYEIRFEILPLLILEDHPAPTDLNVL